MIGQAIRQFPAFKHNNQFLRALLDLIKANGLLFVILTEIMLMNNTSYRKQRSGLAKSSPYIAVVRLTDCSFQYNLSYAFIQSSKDFIN
jgi:hypothetical protein